jgi:glucose-6-phosphate isomerase
MPDTSHRTYIQSIDGCLEAAIGKSGVTRAALEPWLAKATTAMAALQRAYADGSLPLLLIPAETSDADAAREALERLSDDAKNIIFFGTGGSALGGQTLAQIGGWGIPFAGSVHQRTRPRIRFYDNLDGMTLQGALDGIDLATTRFVVTSKSGGTTETLAQAIAAISAVKAAGLADRIPHLFLGITEPAQPGKSNGLRALFSSLNIPMLEHHTGIGGRFSCLTNVGLIPAMARGHDAHEIRRGARDVVEQLLASKSAEDCAPALGATVAIALSKHCGIRTFVMMPYADRLGKFAEWYVQLWAESLGKGGEGTSPIPALGPLDQHSQLQLFMDGPREIATTIVRIGGSNQGPVLDATLAQTAGVGFMGGKSVGEIVDAQSHAVAAALMKAGRPVRTLDVPNLDSRAAGALLMHFMLETIIAGRLLDLDPFDQPAVELAKVLTKERLSTR